MKKSIQQLHNYFKSEIQKEFSNKTIIGGFENMISHWESEARLEGLPEKTIQAVTGRLRDYGNLNPTSRADALRGLWIRLQRESDDPIPDLPFDRGRARSKPTSRADQAQHKEAQQSQESSSQEERPRRERRAPRRRQRDYRGLSPSVDGEVAPLEAPLTVLDQIGPKRAEDLETLGLQTLKDALYYFPRRHDDYRNFLPINRLKYGEKVSVIATVEQIKVRPLKGKKQKLVEAIVSDGSGGLRVTWFNQPWLAKQLRNKQVVLRGTIDMYLGRLVLTNPDYEEVDLKNLDTVGIIPVYSLSGKIRQKWLRNTLRRVTDYWGPRVDDPLPESTRQSANLMPLSMALQHIHWPESEEHLADARHRLSFDEVFTLQLGVLQQRNLWRQQNATRFETDDAWLDAQKEKLPFTLTGAQDRAVSDIRADLASGRPMNRLLQGDVGAGKTVVAALSVAMVLQHGKQAALMAPTSILAEQHHISLTKLLTGEDKWLAPDEIRLLIGSTPEAEKQEIREKLADGTIKLLIGTHALIEDPVIFQALELAIIDEQHRFGVKQRAKLRNKGTNPHILVMTATPIPRSLALTVYGDLDVTVINELPPGRQEIGTFLRTPSRRERIYDFIRKEIDAGRQAFMIFPLVEESETIDAKAAVKEYERLQKTVFPKLNLGLLHGRLKAEEKENVMSRFRDGEYQVLIATSVVEVGVDVPNATVMVIDGANRFGLSQLHQFRGRVGRGSHQSYCILIPDTDEQAENERLLAMVETNDGFVLAERDLEQRGPGEFLGTAQSGFGGLRLASITDSKLVEKARKEAQTLFELDPELTQPEHEKLRADLEKFWAGGQGDIS